MLFFSGTLASLWGLLRQRSVSRAGPPGSQTVWAVWPMSASFGLLRCGVEWYWWKHMCDEQLQHAGLAMTAEPQTMIDISPLAAVIATWLQSAV